MSTLLGARKSQSKGKANAGESNPRALHDAAEANETGSRQRRDVANARANFMCHSPNAPSLLLFLFLLLSPSLSLARSVCACVLLAAGGVQSAGPDTNTDAKSVWIFARTLQLLVSCFC